ncbi:MAG: metallophosphoesterase family protein [Polyangiaceae bacterium]
MGRTIIVGDVHGCRVELEALLDRVAFATGDRLVFVGDLVARGPDSLGVLDVARRTGAVIVRGNHEEKLLAYRAWKLEHERAGKKPKDDFPIGRMHLEIAESLRDVDWTLLETSPLTVPLPEHDLLVVHAGLLPGIPIEAQKPRTLLHIRGVTSRGEATDEKVGSNLWGSLYKGPPHVVFGHNALAEPQFHPWATGLDTSCVYGGRLTAMVLPAGTKVPRGEAVKPFLVSEAARGVHYDWTKRKPDWTKSKTL